MIETDFITRLITLPSRTSTINTQHLAYSHFNIQQARIQWQVRLNLISSVYILLNVATFYNIFKNANPPLPPHKMLNITLPILFKEA